MGSALSSCALRSCAPVDAPRRERRKGRFQARVIDVYDGDTVTLLYIDGLGRFWRRRARLLGVDTPELHGPRAAAAREAREFLRNSTDARRPIPVDFDGTDKYGRLLVRFRLLGGEWAAQALLDRGLGVPMDSRGRRLSAQVGPA